MNRRHFLRALAAAPAAAALSAARADEPHRLDGIEFCYAPTTIFQADERWTQAREPILRRMGDGSLVCLHYSGGPTEPHDDNVVLITRSGDDGASWSAPELLFGHRTRAVWATEVFTGGPRPIIFVHTLDAASHYLELRTYWSFSDDHGRTWSEPVSVPGGFNGSSVRQGVVLSDGTWVFPVYWQEAYGQWDWEKQGKGYGGGRSAWRFCAGVWRSDDGGQTLRPFGRIAHPRLNMWEPNIVELEPNRLMMLLRADGAGVLYRADSTDGGRSWSAPKATDIPDPGAKLTLLKIGDAVVLLHNSSNRGGWGNRTPLALWVSRDGGVTWPTRLDLARAPGSGDAICYPHAFTDTDQRRLYVAADSRRAHYLFTVPFNDFL